MTPFEQSTEDALSFASQMHYTYIVQGYAPLMDELERKSLAATMSGDSRLMAEICHWQNEVSRQVSLLAAEA